MNPRRQATLLLLAAHAALVLMAVGLVFGFFAPAKKRQSIAQWRNRLETIAHDRGRALDRLLSEYTANAQAIADFPTVHYVLKGKAEPPYPFPLEEGAQGHLTRLFTDGNVAHDYLATVLLDEKGEPIVATGRGARPAAAFGQEVFGQHALPIRIAPAGADTLLFVAVPVVVEGRRRGGIVLALDARSVVFTLIAAKERAVTEEVLLVRLGTPPTFLTPRHKSETHLTPTDRTIAVLAAAGADTFGRFTDYADDKILASTYPLIRRGFTVMAKVDEREAFAEYRDDLRADLLMLLGFVIGLSGIVLAAITRLRARQAMEDRRQKAMFAAVLDQANTAVFVLEKDGRIRNVNAAAEQLYGMTREELLARNIRDLRAESAKDTVQASIDRVMALGHDVFETKHQDASGRLFPVEANMRVAEIDGRALFVSVVQDITQRKNAENRIHRLNRVLRTESAVRDVLFREDDPDRLVEAVCEAAVRLGEFSGAWVGKVDAEHNKLTPWVWAGPSGKDLDIPPMDLDAGSFTTTAAQNGHLVIADDIAHEAGDKWWAEVMVREGVRSAAAAPIQVDGKTVATFTLYSSEVSTFADDVSRLVQEIANDIGHALKVLHERIRIQGEKQRAYEQLQEGYELLTAVTDGTNDSIFVKDLNGRYLFINRAFSEEMGYTAAQVIGRTDYDLIPAATAEAFAEHDRKVIATGRIVTDEQNGFIRDREQSWFVTKAPLRNSSGELTGVVGISRDITDRKAADERLRRSEQKYRLMFENMAQGVLFRNSEREVLEANPAAEKLLGHRAELMKGLVPLWETMREDGSSVPSEDYPSARALRTGQPASDVFRLFNESDERWRWMLIDAIPIFTNGQRTPDEVFTTFTDITDLRDVQRELSETRAQYDVLSARVERLLSADLLGIAISKTTGEVIDANDYYLSLLKESRERLQLGQVSWVQHTPAEYRELDDKSLDEIALSGKANPYEKEYIRADGSRVRVLIGDAALPGTNDELISFVLDVTAQHQLERQFEQAQKMEAIGRLAGGVAHDFNNILTAIKGLALMAIEELPAGDPIRDDLEEISRSSDRATSLTRQLLAFSRRQVLQPRVIEMNELVTNMQRMLQRLIGEDIELEVLRSAQPAAIKADPGQIEQVLLNLVVNARDAMPNGGKLTVSIESDEGQRVVRIAVRDNGIGMDEDTLDKIFEPFFTTKEIGKGTGLGLATVYGIVDQSGGRITVQSAKGVGTCFDLVFPASKLEATEAAAAEPRLRQVDRKQTVLLVEDEDGVRRLASRALRKGGFQVIEAANGAEALLAAEKSSGSIDLIITDMVMPGMSGRELAQRLTPLCRHAPVLYMSGYAAEALTEHFADAVAGHFLEKPFSPATLLNSALKTLESATPQTAQASLV